MQEVSLTSFLSIKLTKLVNIKENTKDVRINIKYISHKFSKKYVNFENQMVIIKGKLYLRVPSA